MRRLLAHRDARIYLTGQLFSLFGDSSLWLAMGIWVKTLTGSNAQAGLVFFFFTAPSLLAPVFGLLADRFRRRPLLLVTNTLTAGVVLALLAVGGRGQLWLIDAVMFGYGVSYGILGPAQSALLTVMVPAELLPDANGAFRTAQEGLKLIGPLAGAGLFVAIGAHAVAVIDAATFVPAVISLLLLRVREPAPQPAVGRWATQLAAGARHIWRTIELRHVIIAGAFTTTVFGFIETITYAIAGTGLHRPAAFVGVLAALQGAGAVTGGLSAAPLVRRLGEGRLMGMAMFTAAAGAALEIPRLLAPVIAGDIMFGAAIPWIVVGLITLVQRLTPADLQGRVYSATETLVTTPQTISIALGAALITIAGYQTLLAAMAVTITLAGGYLLTRPEQRQVTRRPVPADTNTRPPASGVYWFQPESARRMEEKWRPE
ncbi:MAG TPA: MFS transporter [Streptosporangiaceae bacterium]